MPLLAMQAANHKLSQTKYISFEKKTDNIYI